MREHESYRKNLAKKLKETPKEDREDLLEEEKKKEPSINHDSYYSGMPNLLNDYNEADQIHRYSSYIKRGAKKAVKEGVYNSEREYLVSHALDSKDIIGIFREIIEMSRSWGKSSEIEPILTLEIKKALETIRVTEDSGATYLDYLNEIKKRGDFFDDKKGLLDEILISQTTTKKDLENLLESGLLNKMSDAGKDRLIFGLAINTEAFDNIFRLGLLDKISVSTRDKLIKSFIRKSNFVDLMNKYNLSEIYKPTELLDTINLNLVQDIPQVNELMMEVYEKNRNDFIDIPEKIFKFFDSFPDKERLKKDFYKDYVANNLNNDNVEHEELRRKNWGGWKGGYSANFYPGFSPGQLKSAMGVLEFGLENNIILEDIDNYVDILRRMFSLKEGGYNYHVWESIDENLKRLIIKIDLLKRSN